MEDVKDQNPRELLLSTTGVKPEEADSNGGGRGEECREAEEKKQREGDQSIGNYGEGREVGGGQCGGIINHLITNLMPVPGSSVGEPQEQKKQEDGSCGLINQLISKLPINPDDQIPAADEASLLISIIED